MTLFPTAAPLQMFGLRGRGSPRSRVQISCNVGESVVADEGVGVREGVFLNA